MSLFQASKTVHEAFPGREVHQMHFFSVAWRQNPSAESRFDGQLPWKALRGGVGGGGWGGRGPEPLRAHECLRAYELTSHCQERGAKAPTCIAAILLSLSAKQRESRDCPNSIE